MNLQHFLRLLSARWRVLIGIWVGFVVLVLVFCLVWPNVYKATSSVLIDVKSADPISGQVLPGLMTSGYMATQIDIITSPRVAQRVVDMLKLDQSADAKQDWMDDTDGKGSFQAWLAAGLLRKLDVQPSHESNVIFINFKAKSPTTAANVANAFARAFIDTNLELKTEPARQYAVWFEERSKGLREQLEKAQTALSAYQQKTGIVNIDERLDVENTRLAELSSQLSVVQGLKADSQSRAAQAKTSGDSVQEVLLNPLIQNLKGELARQETNFQEIAGKFGANHPQYQRAQSEIAELRRSLAAETARVQAGLATSNQVNTQRESDVAALLAAQKAKVLKLKQDRDSMSVLQRDVEVAQRAFEAVSQRLTQTNLESQTSQTNAVMMDLATEPATPSFPRLLLMTLAAILVGPFLAIPVALAIELFDKRVRSVEDLVEALGYPTVGVIEISRGHRQRRFRLQRRRTGMLPSPVAG